MTEKKKWGETVLGWFVTREGEGGVGGETADDLIARYAGAPESPPNPVELRGDVPLPAEAGPVDFPGVFRAAGIADDEQGRIEKARGLLGTLPADTPKDVKRQIVEASLKAFGYPVDQIIEAGAAEIQALQAYIEMGQKDTQRILTDSSARIEALQKEISDIKALMEKKVSLQYELARQCNEFKLRVQEVLEFFGQEAVARVVHDSPKLHEPVAGA